MIPRVIFQEFTHSKVKKGMCARKAGFGEDKGSLSSFYHKSHNVVAGGLVCILSLEQPTYPFPFKKNKIQERSIMVYLTVTTHASWALSLPKATLRCCIAWYLQTKEGDIFEIKTASPVVASAVWNWAQLEMIIFQLSHHLLLFLKGFSFGEKSPGAL